ncbi:hypothetical protein SHO565_32260 [Streptomyces sp. HO565]
MLGLSLSALEQVARPVKTVALAARGFFRTLMFMGFPSGGGMVRQRPELPSERPRPAAATAGVRSTSAGHGRQTRRSR